MTTRRGPGRPTGGSDARDRIVAAARAEFTAHGFDKVSLRSIARAAGVDPSLLHHYFAGKDQVFVAAMALPFDPGSAVRELVEGPTEQLGERLVRFFVAVWSDDTSRAPFTSLVAAAFSNPAAAGLLREFVSGVLLSSLTGHIEAADAELRTTAVASQLLGLGIVRHVLRVEPLASTPDEVVVALIAPAVQRYLDGDLGIG